MLFNLDLFVLHKIVYLLRFDSTTIYGFRRDIQKLEVVLKKKFQIILVISKFILLKTKTKLTSDRHIFYI